MNGRSDAIAVAGLTKRFGRTLALDGLDLSLATGEVHGFLGPNGAGKSTTLRILLGLLRHDGGTVRLLGGDPAGTRPPCTGGWPTHRATSCCGRTSPAAR